MSLRDLPEVQFIEVDPAVIEASVITTYESFTGRKAYPGNPERLFLEAVAYVISLLQMKFNDACKLNLLAYSRDGHLDALAALFGSLGLRLEAQKAKTTLKWELDEALGFDVVIPQGSAATYDGQITFQTTQEATITTGLLSVEVEAEADATGPEANGLAIGQVNRIVTPIPNVTKVSNVSSTFGGSDVEDDEHFQDRLWTAPESFATTGPTKAIEFFAKSVHPQIADVRSTTPSPGLIRVYLLMEGGTLPTTEILSDVEAFIDDEIRRPTSFQFIAAAPTVVSYDLEAAYFILDEYATQVSAIQTKVQAARDEYLAWQKARIGRDINPDKLKGLLMAITGVKRVEVTSPASQVLGEGQVAQEGTVSLTYGGLEDA